MSLFTFIRQKYITWEYFVDKSLCLMAILLQMWYEVYRRYSCKKYKTLVTHIRISEMHVSEILLKIVALYNL